MLNFSEFHFVHVTFSLSYCYLPCFGARQCEEITPESERYWSLLPSLATTDKNMIVTGTRLVSRNKVFHIQIQQARALPEGK